jgi:hypothetical protein
MPWFGNRSFLVKMVKDTPSGPVEEDVFDDIKTHFEKYKAAYIVGGISVGIFSVAGITYLIMRDGSLGISPSVTGTAGPSVTGTRESGVIQNIVSGKSNTLNAVSYFSANRSGPPSWVVRCKETGEVFTSQHAAALAKGITETNLSKHLNGLQDTAQGFHFERLCMAA